jgi:hypothetical protein
VTRISHLMWVLLMSQVSCDSLQDGIPGGTSSPERPSASALDASPWERGGYHRADDKDDGWREQCNALYRQCTTWKWPSKPGWNCYECFRNCEGQHEWPFHLCGASLKNPIKKRRK